MGRPSARGWAGWCDASSTRLHGEALGMSRAWKVVLVAAVASLAHPAAAQRAPGVVGLWATEGYGLVFDFRPDSVSSFEVTKVSCLPGDTFATTPATAGAIAAFRMPNAPVVFAVKPCR